MTNYNVWREDRDRWAAVITPHGANADIENPKQLTYVEARQVVEYMRSQCARGYEVRELLHNGLSGDMAVGYNVWMKTYRRWTKRHPNLSIEQDENNPAILTLTQANELRNKLVTNTAVKLADCAVMEIASTLFECCDIGVIVPAPAVQSAPEPTRAQRGLGPVEKQPEMNWAVYCGFEKPAPKRVQYLTKIDPYTGLPKS
jgi:hypothetical protein